MLGPIVAFAVLAAVPRGFDLLFMISFAFAIVGVGAIVLLVPRSHSHPAEPSETPVSVRGVASLLIAPGLRGLIGGSTILAVATISDAFIYLLVQRRAQLPTMAFPLLYVGTSLFTALFAVPCGRLADRIGRKRVLLGGYALLGLAYAVLTPGLSLTTPAFVVTVVTMMGAVLCRDGWGADSDGRRSARTLANGQRPGDACDHHQSRSLRVLDSLRSGLDVGGHDSGNGRVPRSARSAIVVGAYSLPDQEIDDSAA